MDRGSKYNPYEGTESWLSDYSEMEFESPFREGARPVSVFTGTIPGGMGVGTVPHTGWGMCEGTGGRR